MQKLIADLIAIAAAEVGVKEEKGNRGPKVREYLAAAGLKTKDVVTPGVLALYAGVLIRLTG